MLPSQRYSELISRKRFSRDATQEHAIVVLDQVFEQLLEQEKALKTKTILSRFFAKNLSPKEPIKGCYLWGGVGRGKTFLMDLFYDILPTEHKKRLHFHHFMKDIHHRLSKIKQTKNPLTVISKQLAQEFRVLCLDEFMVHDIGDAMILSELLAGMGKNGITLLTTSNSAPENLYLDGLQRSQFLKTISHLNQHCFVLHVDGGVDYRTQEKLENTVYHSPNSKESDDNIKHWLDKHNYFDVQDNSFVFIQSRKINVLALYSDAVWFEFSQICKTNRSRSDYIELTERFSAVVISNLHAMDDQANDVIRRFITLVDVLYDTKTILILSAEVEIEGLYVGKFLKFEFRRTMSRLHEMQSRHYLTKRI